MKKTLWISRRVPYDGVAHAGGQIHNYLLKDFKKKENAFFYLISFAKEDEIKFLDLKKYDIPYDISIISTKKNFNYLIKKFFSLIFFITILMGFDSFWYIFRTLKSSLIYRRKFGQPDVVVLQWTEMVNQIIWLKIVFPKAKFISIEEDVSFLRKKRILQASKMILKFFKYPFFFIFKFIELHSLNLSDIVVLNNEKDKKLIENKLKKQTQMFVCHPFFKNMLNLHPQHKGKDILFYGAMARPDNYLSAIWFIKNVFPKLAPLGFRFIVVGNKPHETLKKFNNGKNIFITGFVKDPSSYFENSLCLVAPLLMGAGVKIKVIESMSCGLPVLTNDIGIEGIPAQNEVEFFFCKSPKDYISRISELAESSQLCEKIGNNAKTFIKKNFNYEHDSQELYKLIYEN